MFKFLAGWLDRKDDRLDAIVIEATADDQVCAVLRLVLENPGISRGKLADRSGLDQGAVDACVERLASSKLVEQDAEGGCFVAEAARPAVIRYLPLNYQCPGLLRPSR